ncbi:MAG: hypothetical protein AAF907_06585, partial [Planctomycetota bacterium]
MTAAAPPQRAVREERPGAGDGLTDAVVLRLAAKPGDRLFRVLENPDPLRPLLAALSVLPAVLAFPRCRLDRIDPDWGLACLAAFRGEPLTATGPAAWCTGLALRWAGTDGAIAYFALSWAGATLLVWAIWQWVHAAAGARAAAFAAALTATNPVTAAAAASAAPTVAGIAFAVIAAWLWVRAGRIDSRLTALLGGLACVPGAFLAGPAAVILPACVAVCDSLSRGFLSEEDQPRRRDRLPETLRRAGLFAVGVGVATLSTAFTSRSPVAWEASRLPLDGLWWLVGLSLAGFLTVLPRQRWIDGPLRGAAWGMAGVGAVCAASGLWGGRGSGADAMTLSALAAATAAAALAIEGACRPATSARLIAALAALPALALVGLWIWSESPVAALWRAAFAVAVGFGAWGLWEVAAFRWSRSVRGRRLLTAAVVSLCSTGLAWAVRGADAAG